MEGPHAESVENTSKGKGKFLDVTQFGKKAIYGILKKRCEICKKNDAKFVCIKCGKNVCSSCYFTIVGLCKNCVSRDIAEKWKGEKKNLKDLLDIEWID